MKIYFYHPVNFETWTPDVADTRGIGGSETSQIEMSWRLSQRGHEVVSYGPLPEPGPLTYKGVTWYQCEQADFTQPGLWVLYRCPDVLSKFLNPHPGQEIWLVSQDEDYPTWTKEREETLDWLLALCPAHAKSLIRRHPILQKKIRITSNGIKMNLIREVETAGIPERIPTKLLWASSPDRGLKFLLQSFKRAREYVPNLELHVCYGFDNLDKLMALNPKQWKGAKKMKEETLKLADQPGVVWRGRMNQRELMREWLTSGIWCYQTNFTETSCITSMEAQALGAIPITHPLWALEVNVKHGIFIDGDAYGDPLTQARYVAEIVRLATQPALQDQIRPEMMKWARFRFNWERYVDQWENWMLGIDEPNAFSQYHYQHQHSTGRILNIGCDIDFSNLKARGAVNVDLLAHSPILNIPTRADILADARHLPDSLYGRFDSVILGDILEHMEDADAVSSLKEAKKCLENGGDIIVTVPNDSRPHVEQHDGQKEPYIEGESTYHRPVPRERLEGWVKEAGLTIKQLDPIDYTFAEGWGLKCY